MTRLALVVLCLWLATTPARAWEPEERDWFEPEEPPEAVERVVEVEREPPSAAIEREEYAAPSREEAPAAETARVADEARSVAVTREAPAVARDRSEPPEVPADYYRVTEVRVADVTTRVGDLIRYETLTQHQETTSYARVLDTVATGEPSAYDGRAYNGRAALTDGRSLAGTYYEVGVVRGGALAVFGVVFFQDDSELLRRAGIAPPPASEPDPAPLDAAPPEAAAPAPPADAARELDVRAPRSDPAPLPNVRLGVDPTGGLALLRSLEVDRGRRYALRVNAASDGIPVVLERWSLAAGVDDASNEAGWRPPDADLAGEWLRLAPPGTPWRLSLRAEVRTADARIVAVDDVLEIWVRAPAVVE